ncbi:MAG: cytochrome c oxidase cbb3-type subunit [Bryobacterales bacterium]|nr:cytochrome c oxidase cbb3-type subunit [Bryobacterales bacterium]
MKRAVLSFAAAIALSSCDAPGRHSAEAAPIRPAEVADFATLFSQNCSGCHGKDGQGALAVGIGRPVYLAIADDATIRGTTESGRPGTSMPAFAQRTGGMLTEAQIEILVRGIRNWAKPVEENPPAYTSSRPGDPSRGHDVFAASCTSCHGKDGRSAIAITESSYLSLVTDQHLRTVIIAGLPQLGMPDWRSNNKPLSDADVTGVVAWLSSQREALSAQLNH